MFHRPSSSSASTRRRPQTQRPQTAKIRTYVSKTNPSQQLIRRPYSANRRPNSATHRRRYPIKSSVTAVRSRTKNKNKSKPLTYKGPSIGVLLNSPRSRALLSPNFIIPIHNINTNQRNQRNVQLKQWSSTNTAVRKTAKRPTSAPGTRKYRSGSRPSFTTTPSRKQGLHVTKNRPSTATTRRSPSLSPRSRLTNTNTTKTTKPIQSNTSQTATTTPSPTHSPRPEMNNELLEEAARNERANNISSSLPVLEKELELRPVNPRLPAGARNAVYYFLLAYQHRLRGSFDRAVVALTRALNADPHDYRCYVNRAYALSRVGRLSDSLKDLEKAAQYGSTVPENHYNLGLGYQTNQCHKQAIVAFTTALQLLSGLLCSPWTTDRRLDAPMYLALRKATYKSRALSLRQTREYRTAAMDMMRCGGSTLQALPHGLPGSHEAALRKGVASYFDCGDLYTSKTNATHQLTTEQAESTKKSTNKKEATVNMKDLQGLATITETGQPEDIQTDATNQTNQTNKKDASDGGTMDGATDGAMDGTIEEKKEKKNVDDDCSDDEDNELLTSSDTGIWHQLATAASHHTESDIDALVEVLQEVKLLSTLPKHHLRRICKSVRVILLHANDAVFYQSTHAHCMYVILKGSISVHLREQEIIQNTTDNNDNNDTNDKFDDDQEEEEKKPKFQHQLSWEEKHFHADQPEHRSTGTLSTSGGKYLVTLHTGQAFGEQALANSDGLHEVKRSASCVAEENSTILLTISKNNFNQIVKNELKKEVLATQKFLSDINLFTMIENEDDMHNLAMYAESREYDVDDVIVAEGTEQEEGIFIVRSGKCDVVSDLPLHDHKEELMIELHRLNHELLRTQDPVRKQQMENNITKHKMKQALITGGGGKGSRRFTVQHNPEDSYDYRRNAAFSNTMARKMRRSCWNSNDTGKIVDFEQNQRRIKGTDKKIQQQTDTTNREIKMKSKIQKSKKKYSSSFERQMNLAELVPRDTFGFESVFQIAKTKEVDRLTGTEGQPINRVSLVAKTSVEILFIPKRDFFIFTTFETRQLMRKKLMNPKLAHIGYYSRIFKDPTEAIRKQKVWNAYKSNVTGRFESKHAKHALFNM